MLRRAPANDAAVPERNAMQLKRIVPVAALAVSVLGSVWAFAQDSGAPANTVNPAVLEVNGEKVWAAQISMTMSNIAAQLDAQGQTMEQEQMVQMATQRLIEQKLIAQEARRQGVASDELRFAEMMQQVEESAGGRAALEANLKARGSNVEQMETLVREMELSRTFIDKKVIPTIEVSDEDVAAFYEENPEMFAVPEQVHARHIIIAADQNADEATASAARAKAEAARERALAGEDFAELARELSEGPTAENGGDLGFFPHAMMEPEFADAAFALEPGEISDIIRSRYGFHVIKLEERRPAGTPSLDQVSDQIRLMIGQRKTARAVGELITQLREQATITPLLQGTPAATSGAPEGE
jgi:peptidyl-prolyl cis-trans isomerase C